MTQLLEQMAHRYADRIIVFDSPPLLVTTESRVLAAHMGQVVLVVEAEADTHAHVAPGPRCDRAVPDPHDVVLNKSRDRSVGAITAMDGYGYGNAPEGRPEAA